MRVLSWKRQNEFPVIRQTAKQAVPETGLSKARAGWQPGLPMTEKERRLWNRRVRGRG